MADRGADVSRHFADSVAGMVYEDLAADAVDAAKKSVLDTLGVALAASGLEPAVRGLVDLVRESGGRPEASLLGFGGRAPAIMAAFANGALAHSLDYDDLTPWGQHASSSVVPAVFAIAQRMGGVPGQDMIAAVAAGQDIFARLRRHVGWRKDWNLGSVMGVFAATAAAARILGMTREGIHNALGIATQQSCGVMEVVAGTGGDFRGMYAGFSAKGAVLATLLAQQGLTCVEAPFEGRYGIFNTYFDGRYDREGMLADLGRDYRGGSTLYKTWPSVGTSHSHIHATVQIVNAHDLAVEDIREIRVYVGDYHNLMCTPLETRRAPRTLADARFSLPFLVAIAAVRRGIAIWDFTEAGLRDPQVLAVAQKVVPIEDSTFDWKLDLPPGRIEIVTRDGRSFSDVGTGFPGSPESPMTWDDLVHKFEECASAAAVRPSQGQVEAVVRMTRELEALDDATEILRMPR
ncbi:MAG TPA: MmgE/PrpD family protein [Galbitalea sp.]|nr:MmgE/PrpD family protein [Galbitalea sp.]